MLTLLYITSTFFWLASTDKPAEKPSTTAEAAKKIDQECTVELHVKSVGESKNSGLVFLNSENDRKLKTNFVIVLSTAAVKKCKEQKIDDPAAHFNNKTLHVTGKVTTYKESPQIMVQDPAQIKIVPRKE